MYQKTQKITHCFLNWICYHPHKKCWEASTPFGSSIGFMRMASSQHLCVHNVDIYYVIVMNKEVYKLQALGT
jgi:hypothetical protein